MELTEEQYYKALDDIYQQGRFDEYADRMGRKQAKAVRDRLNRQKNCPYCHPGSNLTPHNAWDDGELQFEELDDPKVDNSGDCWSDIGFAPAEKILTSWGEGADPLIININYCPMCGRPLGGNEDD